MYFKITKTALTISIFLYIKKYGISRFLGGEIDLAYPYLWENAFFPVFRAKLGRPDII